MIDVVARERLRPLCALVVAAGLLVALFSLCCCVSDDPPLHPATGHSAGAAAMGTPQDVVVDGVGHVEQECDSSFAAVPVVRASVDGATLLASTDGREPTVAASASEPGSISGAMPLRPPGRQLLCVMRT